MIKMIRDTGKAEQHDAHERIIAALVQRLLELGEDEAIVFERATVMVYGWEKFSDNSMDDRGHETCRDWMDPKIVRSARLVSQDPLRARADIRGDRMTLRPAAYAQAQDTPLAVLIRTYAGSSASFNASAIWRYEGTAARNDSEMARRDSNA